MAPRFASSELVSLAEAVLAQAGLPAEPAAAVALGLTEADLLGHTTHGLALLADYVEELDNGTMEREGRPETIADQLAVATWDARRLPGIWTTQLAVEDATRRAATFGIGAIALRRSHHIACLAAFLEAPARAGLLTLVYSSDPSDAHVAPFGGLTPVMTPNPIAAGIPAEPDPILIDVSTSITTAAMCGRVRAAGGRLNGAWIKDSDGNATNDPAAFKAGGSILPIGGLDHGHKGYGLSLMVEAMTQGLGGYGRADAPRDWGASVLVLALSPAAFGGLDGFTRQTGWLADACRASRVPEGAPRVRLPGEAGLGRKRRALAEGVVLHDGIADDLARLARRFGLPAPTPLAD
ncbi:Ldh family oxidoreductase [Ancylobacter sp. FA202]|uniref:Ldh family oxidoreductase n=1 Tax=Ancylobacter sp. FA202 TaxID=1111106 RepID=UPI000380C05A|nr:Ldh family oxidoreductase [Ancylobacter sp. FA202]